MSPRPDPPDCIVAPGNDARSFDQIRRWRQDGMKIVVDMSERTGLELWSLARQIGAAQALVWTGDGFDVYEGDNEGDQPVRFVAAE
jgi:hypothetical protein